MCMRALWLTCMDLMSINKYDRLRRLATILAILAHNLRPEN